VQSWVDLYIDLTSFIGYAIMVLAGVKNHSFYNRDANLQMHTNLQILQISSISEN